MRNLMLAFAAAILSSLAMDAQDKPFMGPPGKPCVCD